MRGGRKPPVLRSDYKSLAAGIVVQVVTLLDPEGLSFDLLGVKVAARGLSFDLLGVKAVARICGSDPRLPTQGKHCHSRNAISLHGSHAFRRPTVKDDGGGQEASPNNRDDDGGVRRLRRTTGGRRGQTEHCHSRDAISLNGGHAFRRPRRRRTRPDSASRSYSSTVIRWSSSKGIPLSPSPVTTPAAIASPHFTTPPVAARRTRCPCRRPG